jgi:hypothetical protein
MAYYPVLTARHPVLLLFCPLGIVHLYFFIYPKFLFFPLASNFASPFHPDNNIVSLQQWRLYITDKALEQTPNKETLRTNIVSCISGMSRAREMQTG